MNHSLVSEKSEFRLWACDQVLEVPDYKFRLLADPGEFYI